MGMGDDIIGSPESFSAMSEFDKMRFMADMDRIRERRNHLERKTGEAIVSKTVENEGEK